MTSIRKNLLLSILGVLVFSTFVAGIVLYYSAKREMYELFDENMLQIALALDHHNPHYQGGSEPPLRAELKGEQEYLIQFWKDGVLQYSSLPAIPFPLQDRPGQGSTEFQGGEWFYYKIESGTNAVQISQPRSKRFDIVLEVNRQLLIPVLIQLPLMAVIVWLLVGKYLAPLTKLSRSIRMRNPAFLEKLPLDGLPEEIMPVAEALNTLLDRLEERLELQRRFVADAAHELRTPLTAVKLQLDILGRAQSEAERAEAMQNLSGAVARSIRLAEQLLVMARQEPEAALEPLQPLNLSAVMQAVATAYQPLAAGKNIALHVHTPDHVDIKGDEEGLYAMIGNLVSNAIAYTPAGGTVTLTLTPDAVLSVTDSGPGVPAGERARVFDRFYRIRNEGTGSGLGLSIVQRVAERHGATISIEDGPDGRGALFRVTLPQV